MEFSGCHTYRHAYEKLIGDHNSIYAVFFSLADPIEVSRKNVFYWLNLLKAKVKSQAPIGKSQLFGTFCIGGPPPVV